MRPTMMASRARLNFSQKQKSLQQQSSFCNIKNKVYCLSLTVITIIIILFATIYFDVASHSNTPSQPIRKQQNNANIIIESDNPSSENSDEFQINSADIAITSNTAYMSTLDINDDNFLHLLHRRSLGFGSTDYNMMQSILSQYGSFANRIIASDISSGSLSGKYIIITPAAQMCNRMRAFMGTIFLGLMTQRIVFIDIGAEGYAARLNKIFKSPGYEWEYRSLPNKFKTMIDSAPSNHWTFPYEPSGSQSSIILKQVCSDWTIDDKVVWKIDSHAAYLPVMARNKVLFQAVMDRYGSSNDAVSHFDYQFANHFVGRIGEFGQEYIENLEVLLGRLLFRLEDAMQSEVDAIIKETYTVSSAYYKSKGLVVDGFDDETNPLPVIGIHIRSEYVLLMNPKDCKGQKIENCQKPYQWFADCGLAAMQNLFSGIEPFLFIAADTKQAQSAALSIFGSERVHFRPFELTGGSFEGIQEAMIDLVTVSSFDVFVGTPHSSYSEMSSILSQPRRLSPNNEFLWKMNEKYQAMLPVNRMIIPIMTTVAWEIEKLNKYTFGRTIDIDLDDEDFGKVLLPQTNNLKIDYQTHRICKQAVTAGMGWMNLFNMLKNIKCYDRNWHHPNPKGSWFPIADK